MSVLRTASSPTPIVPIPGGGSGSTSDLEIYSKLTPDQKRWLAEEVVGLYTGIIPSPDGRLHKSFDRMVEPPQDGPKAKLPELTLESYDRVFYLKTVLEMTKNFTWSTSASLGVSTPSFGIEMKTEYTDESKYRESTEKITVYLYSEKLVPKIALKLDPRSLAVSAPLAAELQDLVAARGRYEERHLARLIGLFRSYGTHLATEVVVGGKMFAEDQLERTSHEKVEERRKEFKTSVEGKFKAVQAGASGGTVDQSSTTNIQVTENHTITLQMIGGDPAAYTEPARWIGTLGNHQNWRLAKVAQVVPLLGLLDAKTRLGLIDLIDRFKFTPAAAGFPLDLKAYIKPFLIDTVED